MLGPNVIIPFDGNHASIPTGFVRETSLDGRFPKGWGDQAPNTSGGSATHTHTSPGHSHSFASHSHSITTSANNHNGQQTGNDDSGLCGRDTHTHSGTITTINSQSVGTTTASYSSQSNNPPYYEVIFIKSSAYNFIPDDGLVLNQATSRSGLAFHTASANKYLRGAGTGADAGATGGSTTNAHTIDHTHTTSHSHSGNSGGPSSVTRMYYGTDTSITLARYDHTHPITLNSASITSGSNSSIGSQAETVEPAYRTLNAFKNESGSGILPQPGDIAMWLGTVSSVPVGWKLCDGTNDTVDMRDRFLKIPSTASASATGGSNTHTHAAQSHTHSVASHTHSGSVGAANNPIGGSGNSDHTPWITTNPQHTLATVSSSAGALNSATTTADSSDNQPEYRTVVYIEMEFSTAGGGAVISRFI